MRSPVIDGIEELDQDSKIDNVLHIEELDFLESGLQCAFTPLAGDPKTTKMDKKHGSRRETHPLLDRPEFDWPCRT